MSFEIGNGDFKIQVDMESGNKAVVYVERTNPDHRFETVVPFGSESVRLRVDSDGDFHINSSENIGVTSHCKATDRSLSTGWFRRSKGEIGPYVITVTRKDGIPLFTRFQLLAFNFENEYKTLLNKVVSFVEKIQSTDLRNIPSKDQWKELETDVAQVEIEVANLMKKFDLTTDDELFVKLVNVKEGIAQIKPWVLMKGLLQQVNFEEKLKDLMERYEKEAVVVVTQDD